jgi:Arc/MetJ family transcription regulator
MRTTINIDDEILSRASELTGIKEKTALVRMGLEYLIARESAKTAKRRISDDPHRHLGLDRSPS